MASRLLFTAVLAAAGLAASARAAEAEQWYVANLRLPNAQAAFSSLYAIDLASIEADGDLRSARALAAVDGGTSSDQYTVTLDQYDCARGLARLAEASSFGPDGPIGEPVTLSPQVSRWLAPSQPHLAAALRAVCDPASRERDRFQPGDRAALLAWFRRGR